MLGLNAVCAMSASAQEPTDPLPQWAISATVEVTAKGGGYDETWKADYNERESHTGVFDWGASRTGSELFACDNGGLVGNDRIDGSGTGNGRYTSAPADNPAYWGLATDRAYTVIRTVAEGDFATTYQSVQCNGDQQPNAIREAPQPAEIWLPRTAGELAALPVGSELRPRYSHTDKSGQTETTITVTVVARKGAPSKPQCSDGVSNDFDGLADFPIDPGCSSAQDPDELGKNECDNGKDDDGDGTIDWPRDRRCADAASRDEDCRSTTAKSKYESFHGYVLDEGKGLTGWGARILNVTARDRCDHGSLEGSIRVSVANVCQKGAGLGYRVRYRINGGAWTGRGVTLKAPAAAEPKSKPCPTFQNLQIKTRGPHLDLAESQRITHVKFVMVPLYSGTPGWGRRIECNLKTRKCDGKLGL